jgi:hypothetical protein
MFSLDYDDIELIWHGTQPCTQPPDRAMVERLIRSDLRRNVLPCRPMELSGGYFIAIAAVGAIVYVYGEEGSEAFHCIYFG